MQTLLVADDHALVRAGLKLTFQLGPASPRVVEAVDGVEAVELAERERPDVALVDLGMPRLNGLDATARIVRAVPTCKVIILSMHADEESVLRAFREGATGYVLKSAPVAEIALAVDTVQRGEKYVSPGISTYIASKILGGESLDNSPLDVLTDRQREILQLIAEGESTKEIAFRLSLSAKTIEAHRRQIMERLRIYDVANLVRFALRAGLIRPQ